MQKLQVPDNISLRKEIIRGIGMRDFLISLIITALSIVPAVLFCSICQESYDTFFATAFVVFVLAFCLGFFARLDSGLSICDYLRQRANFRKAQQSFSFVYKEVLTYIPEKEDNSGSHSDRTGVCEC